MRPSRPKPHQPCFTPLVNGNKQTSLTFWANNPCSLNYLKVAEITARLETMPESQWPHILFFAKTWFTKDEGVRIKDYQLFHFYRKDQGGGGVAIYVRKDLAVLDIAGQIPQLAEAHADDEKNGKDGTVVEFGDERFLLGCMYRPHDNNDAL